MNELIKLGNAIVFAGCGAWLVSMGVIGLKVFNIYDATPQITILWNQAQQTWSSFDGNSQPSVNQMNPSPQPSPSSSPTPIAQPSSSQPSGNAIETTQNEPQQKLSNSSTTRQLSRYSF